VNKEDRAMPTPFNTPRLRLRPFALSDVPTVSPWFTDPEIMRYMPTGQDYTLEQVTARVTRYINHQEQHGYSRWMMFDRATGAAVGDAGLLYLPATQEVELGYRLAKPYWGQGYATEAAQAWLHHAFTVLGLNEVIAFSHPDNVASVRVMQKIGMTYLRDDEMHGMRVVVYHRRADA
jgi:RimJ/RimL family protein N-acetyltransferase